MFTGYNSPMQPMTVHAWTMSIDIWLGILWCVMLKCFSKKEFKSAMYAVMLMAVIIRTVLILCKFDTMLLTLNPITQMNGFAIGSLLAIILEEREKGTSTRLLAVGGIIGILGSAASFIYLIIPNGIGFIEAYRMLEDKSYYLTNPISGNLILYVSLIFAFMIYLMCKYDKRRRGIVCGGEICTLPHLYRK